MNTSEIVAAAVNCHNSAIALAAAATTASESCEALAECAATLGGIGAIGLPGLADKMRAVNELLSDAANTIASAAELHKQAICEREEQALSVFHQALEQRERSPSPELDSDVAEDRVHHEEFVKLHSNASMAAATARYDCGRIKAILEKAAA